MWEHREGLVPGFSKNYDLKMFGATYETFDDIRMPLIAKRGLKKYKREWNAQI